LKPLKLTSAGAPSVYYTGASGIDDLYHDNSFTWSSVLQAAPEPPPRTSNDDSWNPLEHRVPRFPPAYTAFAPDSPPESIVEEKPASPKDSKPRTTRKKPQAKKATIKGVKAKEISWQHTVVKNGGLHSVFDVPVEEPGKNQRTFGVRKGALDPDTKEKARKIRKLKACWGCWMLKVPVTDQLNATGFLQSLICV
jgi:hypothetical protein